MFGSCRLMNISLLLGGDIVNRFKPVIRVADCSKEFSVTSGFSEQKTEGERVGSWEVEKEKGSHYFTRSIGCPWPNVNGHNQPNELNGLNDLNHELSTINYQLSAMSHFPDF